MDTPAEKTARARRIASGLLFVALVAAGVVLALWVRVRILGKPNDATPVLTDRSAFRAGPDRPTPTSSSRPGGLAPDPLGVGAPRRLKADPTGIAPPPAAELRSAFRMPDGSTLAAYRLAGELNAAARHYTKLLAGEGYVLLGDLPGDRGRRLVFKKGRLRVTVGLRKGTPNERRVDIVVTAFASGGRGRAE